MNLFIGCLIVLACWGIVSYALKAWKNVELEEQKERIKNLENNYNNITDFSKKHGKNLKSKKKVVNDFLSKE